MTSEIRDKEVTLTDWGLVLGGRISNCIPADIDGIMERNGYCLFLEAKNEGETFSTAQSMTFNALLGSATNTCVVVTLDGNDVKHLWGYTHTGKSIDRPCNSSQFRSWVSKWLESVTAAPRLTDLRLVDNQLFKLRVM